MALGRFCHLSHTSISHNPKHHAIFFLWRPYLRDPKDDMVLELAVKAGCESIVTYNTRDFTGVEQFGLQAIEPGIFLQSIGALS